MKIVTMGESMTTLAPKEHGKLRYVRDFTLKLAGAESNCAIGLSKLGFDVYFVSKVGDDEFGEYIRREISAEGVNTKYLVTDENYPTGLMIKQTSPQNETKVNYYRAGSAASTMTPDIVPEKLFCDIDLFHVSGITPVLSETCKETVFHAVKLAKKHGAKVSFDPNIRLKLWKDTDFRPMMIELMSMADFVLTGKDEGEIIFGTSDEKELCEKIFKSDITKYIAIKDGSNGVFVADREKSVHIPPYPCNCVDTVGAGDAFGSGFIAALLEGKSVKEAGHWGAVLGAKATETFGDIEGYLTRKELDGILTGEKIIYR